jgi:hypothetical protein
MVIHLFALIKYILDNTDDGQISVMTIFFLQKDKQYNTSVFAILSPFSVQVSDKYSI